MNTETKVGAFVIGCSLALGVTLYYVGNDRLGQQLTPYKTYLRYAGGVAAGTEVLFGGIAVGRVTAVRSWTEDPTQIEILLALKQGTPVRSGRGWEQRSEFQAPVKEGALATPRSVPWRPSPKGFVASLQGHRPPLQKT